MKSIVFSTLLLAPLLAPVMGSPAAGLEARAPKGVTMVYDCDKGKETCNTMCYSINCNNSGNTFTFDGADSKKKQGRRDRVGCTKKNECQKGQYKGKKYECDEFPFAATTEADTKSQIFRCVPGADQRYQGGKITGTWTGKQKCKKEKGCQFSISFQNADKYKYCKKPTDCKTDGNIWNKNGPIKRDVPSEGGDYRLKSGRTIYSPTDLTIGTIALREVPINETLNAELTANGIFDDEHFDNLELVEDEIVEKL
ncbi:hypothetical protein GQ44DRAFT_780210 [Phaeosphaeriaceae sp. PMI808]|nr:hypothetical protein GQ44DRAFT_780210 [Phaeosphaeriaceae sp. PMI808]